MTTQFARASYQEIIDLHTESDKVSVIGIHTPTSDTPRKMFGGFFNQFKKFKYLGCSISLVPAARLPADPLQVSYGAGEPTIDPRDMLNPIMFHGCHGNDMGAILNRLYALNTLAGSDDAKLSDSIFQVESSTGDISDLEHFVFGEQLENLYYKALTDNTWKKAHPQRGFKKSGLRPMVYSMATNMQFNGSSIEMDGFGIPSPIADIESFTQTTLNDMKRVTVPVTQDGRRFFTPRLIGLGWLDTRNVLTVEKYTEAPANTSVTAMLDGISELQTQEMEASLPLVYMGMILMPPAYKTEQYFRMIVNHHFAFKDFRGISFMPGSGIMADDGSSISPAYANFNDDDYEYDGPTGGEVDPPNPDDPDDPGEGGETTVYSLSKKASQYNGEYHGNFPYWFADVYLAGAVDNDSFVGTMIASSQVVNDRAVGIELYSVDDDVSVYCPCAMWIVSASPSGYLCHRAIFYGGVWKHFTKATASSPWSASTDMTTSDVQSAVGVWPLTEDWTDIVAFCGENGRSPDTVTADSTTAWSSLS